MDRWPLLEGDEADTGVRTLLELAPRGGAALRAGSVRLAPGQRVPGEGTSAHAAEELSLITHGSLRGESGGAPFTVAAGEVTLIPAGEAHWAVAGEEGAEIFWVWFGDLGSG
ncbi:MAG: cupin domain-containing protein [Trueperaceae bacterium]